MNGWVRLWSKARERSIYYWWFPFLNESICISLADHVAAKYKCIPRWSIQFFCRTVFDDFVFLFPYKSNNVRHLTLLARICSHPFAVRWAILLTCTLNTIASRQLLPFVVGSHLLTIVITSFKENTTRQNQGSHPFKLARGLFIIARAQFSLKSKQSTMKYRSPDWNLAPFHEGA